MFNFFLAQVHSITESAPDELLHWIGVFHLIFLHFPIALILSAVFADFLYLCCKKQVFFDASRLMILFAAISVVPTVITGIAYSAQMHYQGIMVIYFWLHFALGIWIALFSITATILRELHINKKISTLSGYYACMVILFFSVIATGFFGGEMSFGPNYFVESGN